MCGLLLTETETKFYDIVLDFEATETLDLQVYRRVALKIKKKFKINILCTDQDVINKSKICLVESQNSIIRWRLARFHRKISCYSKSLDMVSASLLLLFNEQLIYSIIG